MAYSKRTCNQCGYRDIQPKMVQREISYNSGSSKRSFGVTTVLGAALGDKKSTRSIVDSIFNTQGRKYTRKRKIWLCRGCSGTAPKIEQTAAQKEASARAAIEKKKKQEEENALAAKAKRERREEAKLEYQQLIIQKKILKESNARVVEYLRANSKEVIYENAKKNNSDDVDKIENYRRIVNRKRKDALRSRSVMFINSIILCIAVLISLMAAFQALNISEEKAVDFIATATLFGLPILFFYRLKALGSRRLKALEYFKKQQNT